MGFDRLATFISKSVSNDGIEEIDINNNIRKIVSSTVLFDISFLLYNEMSALEDEINDIIKIILCLPFSTDKVEEIEELITNIFNQPHWVKYYKGTYLEKLFDGFNEDEIISKFIKHIETKITSNIDMTETENNNAVSLVDLIVYERIVIRIKEYINKIHHTDNNILQNVGIFFDGIPSFSKIIEQRKRIIRNYFESNEKKNEFKKYFGILMPSNVELYKTLSNKNMVVSKSFYYDYFKWIRYRYSIGHSIGPNTSFVVGFEKFVRSKISNYNVFISTSDINGEADYKIFKYIAENNITGDITIHSTDSDIIHLMMTQQIYYKLTNKDVNLSMIKYIKNNYVQYFDTTKIIKHLLTHYSSINKITTNNYKIVWDLCMIFYFFGTDHLPQSYEISPELGIDYLMSCHYNSLNEKNIIDLKKNKMGVNINLDNFKEYISEIYKSNNTNIEKIVRMRYFKNDTTTNYGELIKTPINTYHPRTTDYYQDLYDYITHSVSLRLSKEEKYSIYYDYKPLSIHLKILESPEYNVSSYINKIIHLVLNQFGNMKNYQSNSILYYDCVNVPPLKNIINEMNTDIGDYITSIKNSIYVDKYINSFLQYIIISPFIVKYKVSTHIEKIINNLPKLDNLWYSDNFNYRKLDIKKLIESWTETIIKANLESKNDVINNEIIDTKYQY